MNNCDHAKPGEPVYLHSRCHPEDPVWIQLLGKEALVICYACKAPVVMFNMSAMREPKESDYA